MDISAHKNKLNKQIEIFSWIGGVSAVFALLPLIWAGYQVLGNHAFFKENELGDFIGGTSGTFASFAGLAFVYVAFLGQRLQILMQQAELELNRQEMKDTRIEIQGQKEQLELQNKQFQIQSFENVFFLLIKTLNKKFKTVSIERINNYTLTSELYSFLNYANNHQKRVNWHIEETLEKSLYYEINYKKSLLPFFGSIKSLIEILISILIHIEKNKFLIDSNYYQTLLYNTLSPIERTMYFYSIFQNDFWLDHDDLELFKQFLNNFDNYALINNGDFNLLNTSRNS